jgi:hypothetical protein
LAAYGPVGRGLDNAAVSQMVDRKIHQDLQEIILRNRIACGEIGTKMITQDLCNSPFPTVNVDFDLSISVFGGDP